MSTIKFSELVRFLVDCGEKKKQFDIDGKKFVIRSVDIAPDNSAGQVQFETLDGLILFKTHNRNWLTEITGFKNP